MFGSNGSSPLSPMESIGPIEEEEGYGGKGLWKRKVSRLEWKSKSSAGVMDDNSGEFDGRRSASHRNS